MDINFYRLIKFIIVYVVFVLGISILSEWMDNTSKFKTVNPVKSYSKKLDIVLEDIKQQIKKDYLQEFIERTQNKGDILLDEQEEIPEEDLFEQEDPNNMPEIGGPGLQKQPEFQENFQNYISDGSNKKYLSKEENELMEHVNAKLNEQIYHGNDISLYNKSRFLPPADYFTTKNLYKNFKKVPNKIDYTKKSVNDITIKGKKHLDIDEKYRFSPGLKSSKKLITPKHKGLAPEKYLFKNNPQLRHTFFDDKYDPENYGVNPMDEYSENFYQITS